MKRFATDLAIAASMAALPALTDAARIETARLALLGGVYAAVALFVRRAEVRRALDVAIGLLTLSTAWFLSFAAWSHSTEIGLYLLFGTTILIAALWPTPAPRRPPIDTEARRLRFEQQALMAIWQ